ncbi:MAG: hypothetical protein ACI8ZN_000052 [Bacteroidia bacterium]
MKLPIDINQIFSVENHQFNELALKIFHFQAEQNEVYKTYLTHLQIKPRDVRNVSEIPFLPIDFFKTHSIHSVPIPASTPFFQSSSTTKTGVSTHYMPKSEIYRQSFATSFHQCFGNPADYCIVALLPNYLEQQHSSLVYMVSHLIEQSLDPDSGFFLHNTDKLIEAIRAKLHQKKKVLLWGVTYALLDLAQTKPFKNLENLTIIETGGMKGRRREMVRNEVHELLKLGFGVDQIGSEYGMTELFSQAYSQSNGFFTCPPWMRVQLRNIDDPFSTVTAGKSGGINVIDLANLTSCSFISTSDIGRMHKDDKFEILGRFDHSDVRGCNLLVQ